MHNRVSIAAQVAFALIGFPLAGGSRRGGRGSAFALCIGIILFYYAGMEQKIHHIDNGIKKEIEVGY